jgi:hypothetical protein
VEKTGKAGKAEGRKRERGRRETVRSVSKPSVALHTYTVMGCLSNLTNNDAGDSPDQPSLDYTYICVV